MLDFQLGTIVNVNDRDNIVFVSSFETGGNIPIVLDNSLSEQKMPKIGSLVLFVRHGMNKDKIIRIWENNPSMLRQGDGRLIQEEVQYQSEGGGYVYLNKAGDVSIVDGSMRNTIRINRKQFQILMQASEILAETFNGLSIDLTKDGGLAITKADPRTDEIKATISIDIDGNIVIDSKSGTIGIKGQKNNVDISGSNIILNNGENGVARLNDDVQVTIPAGAIASAPNPTPIIVNGKITKASDTVKAG